MDTGVSPSLRGSEIFPVNNIGTRRSNPGLGNPSAALNNPSAALIKYNLAQVSFFSHVTQGHSHLCGQTVAWGLSRSSVGFGGL